MNLRDLVSDTYTPTRYNFYEIKVKNGFFVSGTSQDIYQSKISLIFNFRPKFNLDLHLDISDQYI